MGDEAEHGDFRIASGQGTAVIGDVVKSVRETAKVFAGQGTARSGDSLAGSFLEYFRQGRRTG